MAASEDLDTVRQHVVEVLKNASFVGLQIDNAFQDQFGFEPPRQIYSTNKYFEFQTISSDRYEIFSNFSDIASSFVAASREAMLVRRIQEGITGQHVIAFWPKDWYDDLGKLGVKYFGNRYSLFSTLNNKLSQIGIIEQYGSHLLKKSILRKYDILKTNFIAVDAARYFSLEKCYENFVMSARTSAGGSGVFRIRSFSDFMEATDKIATPIVRIEKFVRSVGLAVTGVVFADDAMVYPPQIQFTKEWGRHLVYAGVTAVTAAHLSEQAREQAALLTREVGRAIAKLGYRGVFGCDLAYVPEHDEVVLIELNPRFVGETHFFSLIASQSSGFAGALEDRFLLDPHFLHAASYVYDDVPRALRDHLGDASVLPVADGQDLTHPSLLPFNMAAGSLMATNPAQGGTVGVFFKDPVMESAEVPTVFVPELERLWQTLHPVSSNSGVS